MQVFFDIEKNSKPLFKGLYIESNPYYEYMNKYPVIFLTFKGIGMNSYEDSEKEFISLVSKLYIGKRYVMKKLIDSEKRIYESIMDKTADISEYRNAIANMVEYLYRFHGKQVIVLIDEYDNPIHKGYINNYYDKIIDLIRKVFDGIFKTNNNLFFAVLAGVLKVSKESLLSDPNNIDVYGLMNKKFNDSFGFTEEETKKLLEYYGLELTNDVKNMYDGYNFGGIHVYNPWSIMCYTKRKELDNYWINTSGNELIKIMLNDTNDENKAKIEKLIQGESIAFTYDDKLTYKDFNNHSDINVLLNLFFASGYLTYGYVFEFKIAHDDEDMESVAKDALEQIETKEYYKKLVLGKISDIRKVAIVFSKKNCIVR